MGKEIKTFKNRLNDLLDGINQKKDPVKLNKEARRLETIFKTLPYKKQQEIQKEHPDLVKKIININGVLFKLENGAFCSECAFGKRNFCSVQFIFGEWPEEFSRNCTGHYILLGEKK